MVVKYIYFILYILYYTYKNPNINPYFTKPYSLPDETPCPSNTKFLNACLSSPDCYLYAASDETKSIYIWKRGIESPLLTLTGNSSIVTSLHLSSSDAELYSGLKGGLVVIWDLNSSRVKYNLQGHSSEITTVSIAKCENIPTFLASGSLDGKVKFWDIRARGAPINFKGHLSAVRSIAISPDCNFIASGAEDGVVRLWDIRANKMIKELVIEDQGMINCLEFNPFDITLAYGANDKSVKHWDLENYSLISVTPLDRLPVLKLKFDQSGKSVFSCTNETIKHWMIDDDKPKLLNILETGWKQLQDFEYVEEDAGYAVSIYGSKMGYWRIPFDKLMNKGDVVSKNRDAGILSDFNNNMGIVAKQLNNINSMRGGKFENASGGGKVMGNSNVRSNQQNLNNFNVKPAGDSVSQANQVNLGNMNQSTSCGNQISGSYAGSSQVNSQVNNQASSQVNNQVNIDLYSTEGFLNENKSDNIFVRNGKLKFYQISIIKYHIM